MISISYRSYGSDIDIKSEIRNLKLRIIAGDIEFKFCDTAIKKYQDELNFIVNNLSTGDIISGSLAFKLYGLLDRKIGDIDIIIDDPNRYESYYGKYRYGSLQIENRLGYRNFSFGKWFWKKTYNVDFFINDDAEFIEMDFNGSKLKVQDPVSLISKKMEMINSEKHYRDVITILNKIDLEF